MVRWPACTRVQTYTRLSRQTKTSAVVMIRETSAYIIPSVLGKNVFLDCGVFARMLQFNINLKITVQFQIFSASSLLWECNQQVRMDIYIYIYPYALFGCISVAKHQCMVMKYSKFFCHVSCDYPSWSPVYLRCMRHRQSFCACVPACARACVCVPTVVLYEQSWGVQISVDSLDLFNKIQRDATVCRCLFTAKLLYMFRASIAPITRSTSNCNCSFWYRSYHVWEQQPSASVA
jgi:hypothetical protein